MEPNIIEDEKLEPFALTRIKICRECEHYSMFVCKQCGCFMPLKTRVRVSTCPVGKWTNQP